MEKDFDKCLRDTFHIIAFFYVNIKIKYNFYFHISPFICFVNAIIKAFLVKSILVISSLVKKLIPPFPFPEVPLLVFT